jgi:hypothetical protein
MSRSAKTVWAARKRSMVRRCLFAVSLYVLETGNELGSRDQAAQHCHHLGRMAQVRKRFAKENLLESDRPALRKAGFLKDS